MTSLLQDKGIRLPEEALVLDGPRYLTLAEIAREVGVFSSSNKPHAHAIGGIIRVLGLDTEEFSRHFRFDRRGHQGVSLQYLDAVIPKIQDWLVREEFPEKLTLPHGKTKRCFRVKYDRCQ